MDMKRLLIVLAMLAAACGSVATRQSSSSLLIADRPEAGVQVTAPVAETTVTQPDEAPAAAPAPGAQPSTPVIATPKPIPSPSAPAATPPPNPQTFVRVTVEGAPALNCGSPLDCEAGPPHAYNMMVGGFHVGDVLPYTRIISDVRGKQFYILGPFTPVGLLPVEDAIPV